MDNEYETLLAKSFERWMGVPLLEYAGGRAEDGVPVAQALENAKFALVAHDTQDPPRFRYANKTALHLWEMEHDEFCGMPSRNSAENDQAVQQQRNALLETAMKKGWVDNYSGVRVSKTGKRFEINDVVLWNVVDEQGALHGQAALILNWRHLAQNHARGPLYPQPAKGRG